MRDIITENEDDLDSIHPVHPDQVLADSKTLILLRLMSIE